MKKLFSIIVSALAAATFFGFAETVSAQSWSSISSGVTNDLNQIFCPTTETCFAVGGAPSIGGNGIILKTTNGGTSWTSLSIPTTHPIRSIHCANESTCIAVGDGGGTVLTTTNGGTAWTAQTAGTPANRPWFWDVWMLDSSNATAVGNAGDMYRTTNGGSAWVKMTSGTVSNLHGVYFANSSTGWVTGGSTLLKTTNGGATWSPLSASGTNLLWTAVSRGTDRLWIAGNTLRQSENGGTTLTTMTTDRPVTYRGIAFISDTEGFMVGGGGVIQRTTDGGASWQRESSPTSQILRDTVCFSGGLCYAVGDDGVILRRTAAVGTDTLPTNDTTPPTAPMGLARTSPDTETRPVFVWIAATDNVAVTAYEARIDSGAFGAIGLTTTYTAPSLGVGSHTLYVRAQDAAGNVSPSGLLTFTIRAPEPAADTTPPSAPTLSLLTTDATETTPSFSWTESTDNVGVTGYEASVDGGALTSVGMSRLFTTPALSVGAHSISVRARDAAGNRSTAGTLSFTVASVPPVPPPAGDTVAPTAPPNMRRVSEAQDTTPTFVWDASTDNVAVTSYEVAIDAPTFFSVGVTREYTAGIVPPLFPGPHRFDVRARDAAGNVSGAASLSFTIEPTPPADSTDTTPPSRPTGLTLNSPPSDTTPLFVWPAATDNVGVAAYLVRIDGVETILGASTLSYTAPELTLGSHIFELLARDASGNTSAPRTAYFTVVAPPTDTTPPSSPTTMRVTSVSTDTTPTIAWDASVSPDVSSYEFRSDSGTWVTIGNVTTYTIPTALAYGSHSFGVRARDAAGNRSGDITLSGYRITDPRISPFELEQRYIQTGAARPAGSTQTSSAGLHFSGSVREAGTRFEIEVRDVATAFMNTPTGGSAPSVARVRPEIQVSTFPNGYYRWQARAVNAGGITSPWLSFGGNAESAWDFRISFGDTVAPSAPRNIRIRSGTETSRSPTIEWDAATDSVGVTGYSYQFDGAGRYTNIGTTRSVTRYLEPGAHTFRVLAYDARGNRGPSVVFSLTIRTAMFHTDATTLFSNIFSAFYNLHLGR